MEQFMPHGYCMMWNSKLVALHVLSDAFIALAYFSIPLALVVFVRRRRDVEFGFLFWMFSAFIFSCGLTHVASIFTLWTAGYWEEGWLKAVTALISVATAVALWKIIPEALRIPSPTQLAGAKDDLENANRDLREANARALDLAERAQVSQRAKDEFLAVMSHELRTPMNAILGFADLLAKRNLGPEEQDYLTTIQRSGGTLLRIIDDILDMSSLEAGKLQVKRGPMEPGAVVEEVAALLRPAADAAGVRLEVEIAEDLPAAIIGDRGRIAQILLNLAGNALKHSRGKPVTLRLAISPTPVDTGRIALDYSVSDHGDGISPKNLTAIFEPFTQLDSGITRRHPGVGLGLTISRRLAEAKGGTLTCESTVGQGSTFTFHCNYQIATTSAPNATGGNTDATGDLPSPMIEGQPPEAQKSLQILVAEDDPTNRKLLMLVLKNLGYTPAMAEDGAEALERFRQDRPNCVLMDLQMPGMDGITSAMAIRELEARDPAGPPAYIIALTADVLTQDRTRCLAAGMNEFLTKPLRAAAVQAALARATELHSDACPSLN